MTPETVLDQATMLLGLRAFLPPALWEGQAALRESTVRVLSEIYKVC